MDKQPKLIVLPLQPDVNQAYNGLGLGIHFLLGNMVAIHTALSEFWFGWRVNRIFKTAADLHAFCHGQKQVDVNLLATAQNIRFWLSGQYRQTSSMIRLDLSLYDADLETHYNMDFHLDLSDFWVDFAHCFFKWLAQCNLPLDDKQIKKAVWKEDISLQGLEYLGCAVESTYLNYIDPSLFKDGLFDLEWFEKAVMASPGSYLTHNLKGWAFYKNKRYQKAKASFKHALTKNPSGMGALSGMIFCYLFEKNREKALAFCLAKADVRNQSHHAAINYIEKKLSD